MSKQVQERVLLAYTASTSGKSTSFVLEGARGPQAFLAGPSGLCELSRQKGSHCAWLVEHGNEQRILSDGGVVLATPIDPLLVALPVLERSAAQVRTHFQKFASAMHPAPSTWGT